MTDMVVVHCHIEKCMSCNAFDRLSGCLLLPLLQQAAAATAGGGVGRKIRRKVKSSSEGDVGLMAGAGGVTGGVLKGKGGSLMMV
jgi:hypothetical protein